MYSSEQKQQILASLDNVLESDGFVQAPQLCNFLKFVVEKSVENKNTEIKGYTIGVDALGRKEDFDPQTDPTVRVMAGRLRQALQNHYIGEQQSAPVHINIPKGTYVPVFEFVKPALLTETPANSAPAPAPTKNRARRLIRTLQYALAALAVISIALAGFAIFSNSGTGISAKNEVLNNTDQIRISLSLQPNEDTIPEWFSIEEATEGLITAFSRFKEFEVFQVPWNSTQFGTNNAVKLADYHFSVLITQAGKSSNIRAFSKLVRQIDGIVIWSNITDVPIPKDPSGIDATRISGRVISPLLSPYGVIYADIAKRKSVPPNIQCISLFYSYFAAESTAKFFKARKCLDHSIAKGTASSSIYAMMTFLHLDTYRKQIKGGSANPLEDAKITARKAVELGPQNARAHQALFGVFKILGQRKQAIEAARKAVELNPYDSDIIGDFAAYLVSIGKLGEAGPMLEKAMSLNPSKPVWLEFFAFLHAELTDDFSQADVIASHLSADNSPLAAMAIALSAERNKDPKLAAHALQSLVTQEPGFAIDPAAAMLRRGFTPTIVEKISAALARIDIAKTSIHSGK